MFPFFAEKETNILIYIYILNKQLITKTPNKVIFKKEDNNNVCETV